MHAEGHVKKRAFLSLQALFGRKAGTVIGSEIVKDCAKYQEGLTKASQSNIELHKVRCNRGVLRIRQEVYYQHYMCYVCYRTHWSLDSVAENLSLMFHLLNVMFWFVGDEHSHQQSEIIAVVPGGTQADLAGSGPR